MEMQRIYEQAQQVVERVENKDEPQSLNFLVRESRERNMRAEAQLLWGW